MVLNLRRYSDSVSPQWHRSPNKIYGLVTSSILPRTGPSVSMASKG